MKPSYQLSNREEEVVQLLHKGNSNKLIALALDISVSTVEFHLKNIYKKLQVNSRMELVAKLRTSTVADEGKIIDNGNRLNAGYWVTSMRNAISKFGKELKMETTNSKTRDESNLTFYKSIVSCLTKYAEFDGRASRPEFWWFALFILLVESALTYLSEGLASIFLIAILLPLLAVGTRRLRDSGNSPWWQLFLLAPFAGIIWVGYLWALPPMNSIPEETISD